MPTPLRSRPWLPALGSSLLCLTLALLWDTHGRQRSALSHEIDHNTRTPERAVVRYLQACAADQRGLAQALRRGEAPACPSWTPQALPPRVAFQESRRGARTPLELLAAVETDTGVRELWFAMAREDRRWYVAALPEPRDDGRDDGAP
ncbi:MAG: hypothetical protein OEZ06_17310 [Myxococcales bacterium]|nr:hypothetical protein [Myxococcales bacterium]